MALTQFVPIRHIPQIDIVPRETPEAASPTGFGDVLREAVDKVASVQAEAKAGIEGFLKGENSDLHTVILQNQRAELTFDFALEVRNKVVEAYHEIMRMQV